MPRENVVLFGQSIGTTAAVELASREKVGGVILEAPLLSGLKVIGFKGGCLGCPWPCIDSFARYAG
jgi:pimeloyl-ACP methyl ester carboxylesterase